jgi:hypothetical protein
MRLSLGHAMVDQMEEKEGRKEKKLGGAKPKDAAGQSFNKYLGLGQHLVNKALGHAMVDQIEEAVGLTGF